MPELPEVETVVRILRPKLVGRTLAGVRVSWPRTLGGVSERRFAAAVRGTTVTAVWRRAKYVVVDLDRNGASAGHLVGHLRMTGRMHVEPKGFDAGPYERVRIELEGGGAFHFLDVRKFGRLVWAERPEQVFAELGPEPLGDELDAEGFFCALRQKKRALKPLLLDQSFLAGLGNIYVDESLFAARLHPLTRSDRVSRRKAGALWAAIRSTLAEAIEREGSSFDTFYRTPEGNPGGYQHQFQVYGRGGKPCRACGTRLRRIEVAQRGTHLCPRCQRKPARPAAILPRP